MPPNPTSANCVHARLITCRHKCEVCLESQLSQVQGELENIKRCPQCKVKEGEFHTESCCLLKAEAERDALKAENEKLKRWTMVDAIKQCDSLLKDRDSWADMYEDLLKRTKDLAKERQRLRGALESIKLMIDAQAKDEGLWSIPLGILQPIVEGYLQQELRRLHECVEHYVKEALASHKGE